MTERYCPLQFPTLPGLRRWLACLGWFLLGCIPIVAQPPVTSPDPASFVYIDTITIDGNRKTRPSYILRELEFAAGDSIRQSDLAAVLERNRLRLLNTALFARCDIAVRNWRAGQHVALHIQVAENWYIYPIPVFSLADRNFNVWWKEYDRSLQRVNYGINWVHNNLTGRADQLNAAAQFGYANEYRLTYKRPALNRRQTIGMQASIGYWRTREVAYMTQENKLVFRVTPQDWQLERRSLELGLTWRPGLFTTHSFIAEYRDNRIADSVASELNPAFFLRGQRHQRHASLVYQLGLDHRDIRPYPLNGWLFVLEVRKNGLLPTDNFHLFRTQAEYNRYTSFDQRFSLETAVKGRMTFPRNRPPYYNNQALGYGGNFVRGYEYYVVDGLDFGLLKNSLRINLFNRSFNLDRFVPIDAFKIIPLKLYLTVNSDFGYANDPYYAWNNPLANRVLWGYGIGLDLVAYYDKLARFEWSRNDLGDSGFFLTIKTGI
jgi:outer membrane protein assembly factor BamA